MDRAGGVSGMRGLVSSRLLTPAEGGMKPMLINAHNKRALGSADLMSLRDYFEVAFLSCVPGFLLCLRLLFLVWLRMLTALQAFLWQFSAMLWAGLCKVPCPGLV